MPGPRGFALAINAFAGRLDRLAKDVQTEVRAGMRSIARKAAARARELTPRSDTGGPHLAEGWTVTEPPGGRTLIVENTDPRANEAIPLAGGGETSLLQILELGSRPHEIRPKRPGGVLRFVDRATGEVVFARHVDHPGTRPYSMIGIAATEAAIDVKRLADAVRALVRTRFP